MFAFLASIKAALRVASRSCFFNLAAPESVGGIAPETKEAAPRPRPPRPPLPRPRPRLLLFPPPYTLPQSIPSGMPVNGGNIINGDDATGNAGAETTLGDKLAALRCALRHRLKRLDGRLGAARNIDQLLPGARRRAQPGVCFSQMLRGARGHAGAIVLRASNGTRQRKKNSTGESIVDASYAHGKTSNGCTRHVTYTKNTLRIHVPMQKRT